MVIKIGVLELQGDFALHHLILQKIGVQSTKVKKPLHLDGIDGLVIPGGESTTMSNLIETFDLREGLIDFSSSFPIMGTCAQVPIIGNELLKSIKPSRKSKVSIKLDIVVDSPPGITRPSIPSKCKGFFTLVDWTPIFCKIR